MNYIIDSYAMFKDWCCGMWRIEVLHFERHQRKAHPQMPSEIARSHPNCQCMYEIYLKTVVL